MGTRNLTIGSKLGGRRMLTEGRKPEEDQPQGWERHSPASLPESMETSLGGKQFGVASRYFWRLIGALAFGQ